MNSRRPNQKVGSFNDMPEKDRHDLADMLDAARKRVDQMNPEEREKMMEGQRASWARAMTIGCEHGVLDFEQCPQCRGGNTDD